MNEPPASSDRRPGTGVAEPRVGLVLVDYRCWSESREALATALWSRRPLDWLVVVDNGGAVPGDQCRELSDRLQLIRAPRNGGFAYGVNIGLRRLRSAGATHAMVLNPDARLRVDTLQILLDALGRDPGLGMVGPVVYEDEAEERIEFAGADAHWHLGWLPHRTVLRRAAAPPDGEPFLMGCCWLMRLDLLDRVGELPEGYFLYFEDTDYCQSIRRRGYRLAVVPAAGVVHRGSCTVRKNSALFRYQLARNRIWFMRRWARPDQYAAFLLFTAFVKVPLAVVLFGLRSRDWAAVSAFLQGSWHGLTRPVFSMPPPGPPDPAGPAEG